MLKLAQPLDPTKKVVFLDHVSCYIHVIMLWCKIGDFVHVIDLQFDFLYCFYIQAMVSRLVLLVHSFFHEKLLWFPLPFKLQFDVDMANSRLYVTIDDVLVNDINIETQTLCPNGFPWCGLREKDYTFLFTLIHACCAYGDFVVDLIARTSIIQFNF